MSKNKGFLPGTAAIQRVGQTIYKAPPRLLMIGQVVADPQIQIREEGLDQEVVDTYAQLMRDGVVFPAIDVFEIAPRHDGRYYVADGFHRLKAAKDAGLEMIFANVHQGTLEEAQAFAAEANLKHGKHLSTGDKKKVFMLLRGKKWETLSLRSIAAELAVVPTTISNWEGERLSKIGQSKPETVKGKDGRVINVGGIREAAQSRPHPQPLPKHGEGSNPDDDLTPDPSPNMERGEEWEQVRDEAQAALDKLIAERDEAQALWALAEAEEKSYAPEMDEARHARYLRIQRETQWNRLDAQVRGLQEQINGAVAVYQTTPQPNKADEQLKMKLAFAVQKGWVDPDQAELHTWEDLDPFNATRFRLRNVVTREIIDPHSRPVERVEQAIKAVQTAEDKVNKGERIEEENERKQRLRSHFSQWMSSLKFLPFFLPNDFIVEIYSEDAWALKDMVELKIVELMRFWKVIEGTIGSDNAMLTHALHAVLEVLDEEG